MFNVHAIGASHMTKIEKVQKGSSYCCSSVIGVVFAGSVLSMMILTCAHLLIGLSLWSNWKKIMLTDHGKEKKTITAFL